MPAKHKYTSVVDTPLRFYKFLCVLLPISCVLGSFLLIARLIGYTNQSSTDPASVFWIAMIIQLLQLVVRFLTTYHLQKRNWIGVVFFKLDLIMILALSVISRLSYSTSLSTYIGCAIACLLIFIPCHIYFQKRRLLFSPLPHTPAIPQTPVADLPISDSPQDPTDGDSVIDDSNTANSVDSAHLKPKKPVFERYETYIVCPGCGSMVAKGTTRCDCGYDLRSPVLKTGEKALRYVIPAVLCLCFLAGGFFIGRASMASDLETQYNIGYNKGSSDGYSRGMESGIGITEARFGMVYEQGYRHAMADSDNGSGHFSVLYNMVLFDNSALRSTLAREYGFASLSDIADAILEKYGVTRSGK